MKTKLYYCTINNRKIRFETLDKAIAFANEVFDKTKIVLGIETE